MSAADVLLDIENVFDATWHLDLLSKLSDIKFPISVI
jgi:hypothetical protein